jgi:hypothetical protein
MRCPTAQSGAEQDTAEDTPSRERLLSVLRGEGVERPVLDPMVAEWIRSDLEDAAAAGGRLPVETTVRVTKSRLRQVLTCERGVVEDLTASPGIKSPDLVRGQLLDRIFALVVVGWAPGVDPVRDALGAAGVSGDTALSDAWQALTASEKEEVREEVVAGATSMAARWPVLPANASARLQELLVVELAGGRIVLSGRVDLAVGRPTPGRSGTTLVDVKSGRRRHDDVLDADWYAVLESVRHRAPPFQAGNYYLRDGSLVLHTYDEARLERSCARVADGVARLARMAAGAVPVTSPGPSCAWCPGLKGCSPGRQHLSERDGIESPRMTDPEDEEGTPQ